MKLELPVPDGLRVVARDVVQAGGRALVVGGGVRDHLVGLETKDWDVEVFGLDASALESLLGRYGPVNAVGRAFGVFKMRLARHEIDVSIPRRDSKVGPGHTGIAVAGDPTMTLDEAVQRRDLTVNALMVDLGTGELVDRVGGLDDLRKGRLHPVDPSTFLEDPLRAVRAVQFAARLGFAPTDDLLALCARAALDELPDERIGGEWRKLLLKGRTPSLGLELARRTGMLHRLFPALVDDPAVGLDLDRAVDTPLDAPDEGRRLVLGLLVWLHPTPLAAIPAILDRLSVFRVGGYPARERLLAAHGALDLRPSTDADLRHLSTRAELDVLLAAQQARRAPGADWLHLRDRASALGILHESPARLLQGRHLQALGVPPGPGMGRLLARVYDAQLDGAVGTHEQARALAKRLVQEPEGPEG